MRHDPRENLRHVSKCHFFDRSAVKDDDGLGASWTAGLEQLYGRHSRRHVIEEHEAACGSIGGHGQQDLVLVAV